MNYCCLTSFVWKASCHLLTWVSNSEIIIAFKKSTCALHAVSSNIVLHHTLCLSFYMFVLPSQNINCHDWMFAKRLVHTTTSCMHCSCVAHRYSVSSKIIFCEHTTNHGWCEYGVNIIFNTEIRCTVCEHKFEFKIRPNWAEYYLCVHAKTNKIWFAMCSCNNSVMCVRSSLCASGTAHARCNRMYQPQGSLILFSIGSA